MNTLSLSKEEYRLKTARKAFFLGIGALFSIIVFPTFVPGALGSAAIIFAALSRAEDGKRPRDAKRAVIAGALAIVLSMVLLIGSVGAFAAALKDPEMRQELSDIMYRMYGYTLDEFLQNLGLNL